MRILKKILGVITALLAIIYFASVPAQEQPIASIILGVIMLICTILLFRSANKVNPKSSTKTKKQLRQEKAQEKLKTCTMKHVNGLPIAEGVDCNITLAPDKFIFSSGNAEFELEKSKITDICIKTDTEIQQQYVSSIGGAVGGAVLFGPLGAIIGGRAKKKTVRNQTCSYLIITYQSPDIKYIGFEIGINFASANLYVSDFQKNTHVKSTYQL